MGWAFYLVTLLPVIGLVQVSVQGMADRYSYVPSLGVFVAVVVDWSPGSDARALRPRKRIHWRAARCRGVGSRCVAAYGDRGLAADALLAQTRSRSTSARSP